MYAKLLLPTDGAHESHAAVEHAIALARATGAGIVILEVIESPREVWGRASARAWPPAGGSFLTEETVAQLIESERRAATEHLHGLESELHRAGIENVEVRVIEGKPGPAIVAAAHENACDAIVMATHGRSGIARLLLGSVAAYVTQCAECAVVLIPVRDRIDTPSSS